MAEPKDMELQEEMLEEDEDTNIVELTDEEGNVVEFEYLSTVEYDKNNYVVLMEISEDEESDEEDEGEVVILKIAQDDKGEDVYVSCDNDETCQKVFDLFMAQVEEEDEE